MINFIQQIIYLTLIIIVSHVFPLKHTLTLIFNSAEQFERAVPSMMLEEANTLSKTHLELYIHKIVKIGIRKVVQVCFKEHNFMHHRLHNNETTFVIYNS